MSIEKSSFGVTKDGVAVTSYTMSNGKMSVRFIDLGGTVTDINVPDKNGVLADVVLGYDDPDLYLTCGGYPGAILGRVGNRIGGAKFTLDGVLYKLYVNDHGNHLHGGRIGFDRRMWDVKIISDGDEPEAELTYVSPDGEEGYPGTLTVRVTYKLTKDCELSMRYTAVTDKRTVLNLTNHSYFNLAGAGSGDVLDHELLVAADEFGEVDGELIPTGRSIPVDGRPQDFRVRKRVGQDIDADDEQLRYGQGYDLTYILHNGGRLELAAKVWEPVSGRTMTVYTDQPAVQLYTGNCLDESEPPFKNGARKIKHAGLCLETQHYPDSPNHPEFPSVVLSPGEVFDHTTVFAFSVE